MARVMGLEPTTFGVTGQRSKPTELHPRVPFRGLEPESLPGPFGAGNNTQGECELQRAVRASDALEAAGAAHGTGSNRGVSSRDPFLPRNKDAEPTRSRGRVQPPSREPGERPMLFITRQVEFCAAHTIANPAWSPEENLRVF